MRLFPTPRFTFAPMARLWRSSDRAGVETARPIQLRAGDKLLILRSLNRDGKWKSLDDKRECLRCGTVFSGRQVDVVGGTRAWGPLRLLCPSGDCQGNQNDWVVPGQGQRSGMPGPLLPAANVSLPNESHPVMAPTLSAYGSVVRVARKRTRRAKPPKADLLPATPEPADHVGAVKKITRLFNQVRART